MKINPLMSAAQFINRVRKENDSIADRDPSQGNPYFKDQKKEQDQSSKEDDESADQDPREFEKKLRHALEAFRKDSKTLANGLSASFEGKGSNTQVYLKDTQGAVIKQYSGPEFVRLHRISDQDTHHRGKVLDVKY